jgi:hypothetical protein
VKHLFSFGEMAKQKRVIIINVKKIKKKKNSLQLEQALPG